MPGDLDQHPVVEQPRSVVIWLQKDTLWPESGKEDTRLLSPACKASHQFAFCHHVCKCIPQNWSSEETSEQSSAMQLTCLRPSVKWKYLFMLFGGGGGVVLASNNSIR